MAVIGKEAWGSIDSVVVIDWTIDNRSKSETYAPIMRDMLVWFKDTCLAV